MRRGSFRDGFDACSGVVLRLLGHPRFTDDRIDVFVHRVGQVVVHAFAERQHKDDAHDADASAQRDQDVAAQFLFHVQQGHADGREETQVFIFLLCLYLEGVVVELQRRAFFVIDDFAVIDCHDAGGTGSDTLRMGDHDDQFAGFCDVLDDVQNLIRRLGIERPGRFVGDDDVRVVDKGPRYRHPLLLPAG
ncbi:hypothetical protein SDC9_127523 [bioreactor metagenome]|uniref:Uncharacterized protein n=1 Tax=bioreactor metagenome TaxID=1076179 RepID=A0A645CTN5_9ZZZZ